MIDNRPSVRLGRSHIVLWMPLPFLLAYASACGTQQPMPARDETPAAQVAPLQAANTSPSPMSDRAARAAELVKRLGPTLSRDMTGLNAVRGVHGTGIINLQGRFHHAMVAYMDREGDVQLGCVDSAERAQALLAGENKNP